MTKLFGIPMGRSPSVLAVALVLALGAVAVLAAAQPHLLPAGHAEHAPPPGAKRADRGRLMLGTAIIAAALATGDTMSQRSARPRSRRSGRRTSWSAARGATPDLAVPSGSATGVRYFPQGDLAVIRRQIARSPLVDGIAPAIIEPVAAQDVTSRQNEPQVDAVRQPTQPRSSRLRRDHHRRAAGRHRWPRWRRAGCT